MLMSGVQSEKVFLWPFQKELTKKKLCQTFMDRISLWGALKGQEKNMLCNVIATRIFFWVKLLQIE
jgi:hypothetical protein